MELRVLEYFLAVAREQSISGAAEYLHLTQPTLSRQLRELEEELGCTLLVRGKRGQRTALTPEGGCSGSGPRRSWTWPPRRNRRYGSRGGGSPVM